MLRAAGPLPVPRMPGHPQPLRALLLTGPPGCGKTTVIRRVAGQLQGRRLRGFTTEEIREGGERAGFWIETLDGRRATLAHVRFRSPRRVGRYGVDLAALDAVVAETLADDPAAVYLIDEIGRMECLSPRFIAAVRALLDAGRPVVATVALRGAGFIEEVKRRAGVQTWEVTRHNRDGLADQVAGWIAVRKPAR